MHRLLLIIFAFSALAGNAGENLLRFFEDGKSWICDGYDYTKHEFYQFKVSVCGDTIVGGVTARKLQSEMLETGEISPKYQVGYEADGKVYIWLNDGFRLFFDFVNLNVENAQYRLDPFGQPILDDLGILVCEPQVKNVEGIKRKIYQIHEYDKETSLGDMGAYYWVEGIGTHDGFFVTKYERQGDLFWNYSGIDKCYLYDTCIYKYSEFDRYPKVDPSTEPEYSSVSTIERDDADESIYDLMGRKVTTPQPGHIYVTPSGKRIF